MLAQLDAEAGAAQEEEEEKEKEGGSRSRPRRRRRGRAGRLRPAPARVTRRGRRRPSARQRRDDWEAAADAGAPAPLEESRGARAGDGDGTSTGAPVPAAPRRKPRPRPRPGAPRARRSRAAEDAGGGGDDRRGARGRRRGAGARGGLGRSAAPATGTRHPSPVRRRGTVINVNRVEGYCFMEPVGRHGRFPQPGAVRESGDRIGRELVPSGRRSATPSGLAARRPLMRRGPRTGRHARLVVRAARRNFAARPACRRCGAARSAPKDEAPPVPAGRFTGVVVGAWRGCYFLRGEDGSEDLLLHADDLDAGRPTRVDLSAPPDNAILAVGDRVCYALAPARYADRLAYYRLASTSRARARRLPTRRQRRGRRRRRPGPSADEPLDPPVVGCYSLGLESVGPVLMREEIDWESLCLLDTDSLVDCGVDATDARRICERVDLVKSGAAPVRAASDPERECPICFEPERSTALVPCGHILCRACAAAHESCPVCRAAVTSRLRLFH